LAQLQRARGVVRRVCVRAPWCAGVPVLPRFAHTTVKSTTLVHYTHCPGGLGVREGRGAWVSLNAACECLPPAFRRLLCVRQCTSFCMQERGPVRAVLGLGRPAGCTSGRACTLCLIKFMLCNLVGHLRRTCETASLRRQKE